MHSSKYQKRAINCKTEYNKKKRKNTDNCNGYRVIIQVIVDIGSWVGLF